jgi:hypothetical protein
MMHVALLLLALLLLALLLLLAVVLQAGQLLRSVLHLVAAAVLL